MIDAREEFSDIALQNPDSPGIILVDLVSEGAKTINGLVRSFAQTTGKRIGNEGFIEKRIKDPVNGVMDQTVADSRFMDIIDEIFSAASLTPTERLAKIKISSLKLDSLKFFLQIAWQIKSLDTKKYAALSGKINEVGKMLGGWIKGVEKQNSRF